MGLCPHALVADRRRRVDGLFVAIEQRSKSPLVRLGILRSGPLGDNLAAMTFSGAWISTQFIATLYMQDLRGWSALQTGVAFLPAGLVGLWSRRAWRRLSSALGFRR